MVRQRISVDIPIKRAEVADNLPPEPAPELDLQRTRQVKTEAINNWLNSRICGKAC